MTVLQRIARFRNRPDEVANQELARDLARKKDRRGIREIAGNLWNQDKAVQSDCVKVLYEIGYMDPVLIAEYAEDFVKLLKSRNNRLVWGGMIALGTVAALKPDVVLAHVNDIQAAIQTGSVITVDNAVVTLARAASAGAKYRRALFPLIARHLKSCRPKDVPQHSEKSLAALNASNKQEFVAVLTSRLDDLSGAGLARVKRVIRQAEAL